MQNKIVYHANTIIAKKNLAENIAEKAGIPLPSSHLAILIASLAPLDEPNNNGVRLSAEASEKFLKTIRQAQVNFSHAGAWFVCGAIIDEWIDKDTNETKVAFTFYKDLYEKEYTKLLEAQTEGSLGVSFELLADMDATDKLNDGTVVVNSFEYTGMGLLGVIDEKNPAYDGGRIHEFASDLKKRVKNYEHRNLICASEIEKQCDSVLSKDEENIYILSDKEISDFVSEWQDKFKKKKKDKNKKYSDNKPEEKTIMTEEQKKQVADLRAELEGFIKAEVTDEQLLDEKVVAEIREAKVKAEESKEEAEDKAEEKEEVSAESKHVSNERYITETTYKDDGTTETHYAKECTYSWVDSEGQTQTETVKSDVVETRVFAEEQIKEIETKAEETQEKLKASEEKISDLEAQIEAQNEEIATFKAEKEAREAEDKAKELAKIKASLKGNKYVADFKDEDYFDSSKVENAKLLQERDDLKAENEALKKTTKTEIKAEETSGMDSGNNPEPTTNVRKLINEVFKR